MLIIHCLLLLPIFVAVFVLLFSTLYVSGAKCRPSHATASKSHRTLIVTINVLWLFHAVSWVGLQCLIVVFPDHTHLLI